MTVEERLEEIKSRVWKDKGTYAMGDYSQREGYIYTLSDYDYEWLIEQAKRVQELEDVNNQLERQASGIELELLNMELTDALKQNKRYKQALKFYAEPENYCVTFEDDYELILKDNGKIARQTLKGEKINESK